MTCSLLFQPIKWREAGLQREVIARRAMDYPAKAG